MKTTKLSEEELENCKEPTQEEIRKHMVRTKLSFYNAREELREKAYGGKPPNNYASWGDYWKSY